MNANDVIESYVADVAAHLPLRQRNDVAFELRALLHEELQGKAEAAGRVADAGMATELARAFGRPADVAARYRPTLTIIDPADGHAFLRAAVIGLVVIWSLGLLANLRVPIDSGSRLLTALGQWWGGTVIPSLWWPGMLVVGFGTASWSRRRRPQASQWKPRVGDRGHQSQVAMAMGVVGILCGLALLNEPRWILDVVFGGRAAPAAYDALKYTEGFRQHQAPLLFSLLLLNIPLMLMAVVSDRWSALMRRARSWLSLATCAVMTWTALDGPVFITPISDRTMKGALLIIVAVSLVQFGLELYRGVRPAPDRQTQA